MLLLLIYGFACYLYSTWWIFWLVPIPSLYLTTLVVKSLVFFFFNGRLYICLITMLNPWFKTVLFMAMTWMWYRIKVGRSFGDCGRHPHYYWRAKAVWFLLWIKSLCALTLSRPSWQSTRLGSHLFSKVGGGQLFETRMSAADIKIFVDNVLLPVHPDKRLRICKNYDHAKSKRLFKWFL